jgi:hypothetical protein
VARIGEFIKEIEEAPFSIPEEWFSPEEVPTENPDLVPA